MSWLQRPQLYWNFSLPPMPLGQSKPSSLKWCRGPFTDPILMGPESDQGHHPPAGSMSVYLARLSFQRKHPRKHCPSVWQSSGKWLCLRTTCVLVCLSALVSHSRRWHWAPVSAGSPGLQGGPCSHRSALGFSSLLQCQVPWACSHTSI